MGYSMSNHHQAKPKKSNFFLPYNRELLPKANCMRKNPTLAEEKLWQEYLRSFKFRVLRQRPINNFIVDFYCAALKLVIEVDGDSHFTEQGKIYDEERSKILKGYGLYVIRFTNYEVINQLDSVCKQIHEFIEDLGKSQSPPF